MSGVQAAGFVDNLRLAKWILAQGDEAQALLGYYQAFKEASTVRDRWEQGLRPAGDLTVAMVESFPTIGTLAEASEADVQAAATAKGISPDLFLKLATEFLPLVIELVQKLRS